MALAAEGGVSSKALVNGLVRRPSMCYVRNISPPARKEMVLVDVLSWTTFDVFRYEISIPSTSRRRPIMT